MDSNDSIADLKDKIKDHEEIPPEPLIFSGEQLKDNRCVCDYNIQQEWNLHLVL